MLIEHVKRKHIFFYLDVS